MPKCLQGMKKIANYCAEGRGPGSPDIESEAPFVGIMGVLLWIAGACRGCGRLAGLRAAAGVMGGCRGNKIGQLRFKVYCIGNVVRVLTGIFDAAAGVVSRQL